MNTERKPAYKDDEIRLKEIVELLWRHKTAALLATVGLTVAVTIAAYMVPRKYSAATIVEPVTASTGNQQGVLGSLSSGLAALAGGPTNSDPKKVESVAILQSEALTERYIQANKLLPILFANLWDPNKQAWKTTDPAKVPTLWKGNEYFRKYVRAVTTDVKTGLVTVTITWKNPTLAATWANGLVQMTNDYERDSAIREAEQNISYLTEQAAKTDVIGIKQVIYSLLESEFSKAMLAKGNREYSFKIIDPAVVPEKASYPEKAIWVMTAIFASISLAIFGAFCIVAWRKL